MAKIVNLIGQKFGRLTVVAESRPKKRSDGRFNRIWQCLCECGNMIFVSTSSLTTGNTKSCGCYKRDKIKESLSKDISGMQFNDLFVLRFVGYKEFQDKHKKTIRKRLWECRCVCGRIINVVQDAIISGHTKSCGCRNQRAGQKRIKDLTGKRFGLLVVQSLAEKRTSPSGQTTLYWNCICNCGNKKVIRGTSLKSGYATSCGCYRKKIISEIKSIDLTNERFGMLKVLKRVESKKRHVVWKCICDCGNIKNVSSDLLLGGHTTSCGCKGRSSGETSICMILDHFPFKYSQWYSFEDLRGRKNMPLYFDFAILGNDNELLGLIEYQGEQHYVEKSNGFGDTQRLRTDPQKRKYCKEHNIPLCEIRYDENIMSGLQRSLKTIYSHANFVPSFEEKKV